MRRSLVGMVMGLVAAAMCLSVALASGAWSARASTTLAETQAAPRAAAGAGALPVPLVQLAPTNVITSSARGEVMVAPDMATVTAGVVVSQTSAQGAQNAVNKVIASTVGALHSLNIPDTQIQTINVSIVPQYSDAQTISGYTASEILSVVVTKLRRVGVVVDAMIKAGATSKVGVAYGLADTNAAYLQALDKATRIASSHAAAMARALGKSLVTSKVESRESGPVVEHRTPTTITSPGGLLDFRVDVALIYTF